MRFGRHDLLESVTIHEFPDWRTYRVHRELTDVLTLTFEPGEPIEHGVLVMVSRFWVEDDTQ